MRVCIPTKTKPRLELWAKALDMRSAPFRRDAFAPDSAAPPSRNTAPLGQHKWSHIWAQRQHKKALTQHAAAVEHMKKVEVVSLRVPFENPLGTHESLHTVALSLLNLVAQAAHSQSSYEIFDCLLVRSMLQFKWENFARAIYLKQLAAFLLHLLLVCVFSYVLSRTYRARTWQVLVEDYTGQLAVALFPFVSLISGVFFFIEIRQLLVDGSVTYFNDPFKYLDLLTFAMQIVVDALFVTRSRVMRPVCAFNVLLFFFKILTFTRGFDNWGPLVRMIMKVCLEVRNFVIVIIVAIIGFAMAFTVALGPATGDEGFAKNTFRSPISTMYWISKTGLYTFDTAEHDKNVSNYPDAILLFEIMMFAIALILLNLLIAIMNSAYEDVKVASSLEVLYQKANIISSMEKLWLPLLIQWGSLDKESLAELYPKWLHILVPLASFQRERLHREAPGAPGARANEILWR